MLDHHTLLVVAGFALGSILHAAVTHYKVPALMVARAAVATAKKTIVEAFEDVSDDESVDEDPRGAAGPACCAAADEQASRQLYPLAVLTQPITTQLMPSRPSAPQPPILQPRIIRCIQHRFTAAAGLPALWLEELAVGHRAGYTPVWSHYPTASSRQTSDLNSSTRRPTVCPSAKLGSNGVAAFTLKANWGCTRVSTVVFVATAAVIGVTCFWWGWESDTAQQQGGDCSRSNSSSKWNDTAAVSSMVLSSRQQTGSSSSSSSSRSTGLVGPNHQYAVYLPHSPPSLNVSFLQQPPVLQAEHSDSLSTTTSSRSPDDTAATRQQDKVNQQHLGVSLHQQSRLDRDISLLGGAVQKHSPGRGSSSNASGGNSGSSGSLAAWFDLIDQYESGEVQLAEALAHRSLGQASVR